MHKTQVRWMGFVGALMLSSAGWAQTVTPDEPPPPDGPGKGFFFKMIDERGAMDLKPVAGAPYSADQTTTTTQTLADGNRIVQTSNSKVYRDQQGRTRLEHSLGNIGSLGSIKNTP